LREKILSVCAPELWVRVGTVLDDSCTHFNDEYSHIGKLENHPENGRRIIVALTFPDPEKKSTYVLFQFDEDKRRISVTTENGGTERFEIDADIDANEAHCFIKSSAGKALTVNDFAEATLKNILFPSPTSKSRPPKRGASAG